MGKLEKYTTYKESGVEWLGKIPEHWEVLKIKQLFFEKKKTHNINLNCGAISYGEVVKKDDNRVPEETKKSYQVVKSGDFLINPLNLNFDLVSLRIALSEMDVVVSSGYIVLDTLPNVNINKRYFKWLLHRYDVAFMKTLGSGVRQTLNFPQIGKSEVVLPLQEEQTKIASFLDEKTAQIDKAISQKEKLIELLKERRQIVINEAVTKGLDKEVEFKDSGAQWIGEIPKHWSLLANKHIFKLKKDTVGKNSSEYSLLSLTLQGIIKRDLDGGGKFPAEFDTYQEVKQGDFVFCLFDVEETPRTVGLSEYDGMITGAYTVMSVKDIDRKYLYYFYLNLDNRKRLKPLYKGLRNTIPKDSFFSFKTFVPPKEEQLQIVEYIETQTAKIDKAIELQQNYIAKLKEYKASLIDGVVTGKVRVCDE